MVVLIHAPTCAKMPPSLAIYYRTSTLASRRVHRWCCQPILRRVQRRHRATARVRKVGPYHRRNNWEQGDRKGRPYHTRRGLIGPERWGNLDIKIGFAQPLFLL